MPSRTVWADVEIKLNGGKLQVQLLAQSGGPEPLRVGWEDVGPELTLDVLKQLRAGVQAAIEEGTDVPRVLDDLARQVYRALFSGPVGERLHGLRDPASDDRLLIRLIVSDTALGGEPLEIMRSPLSDLPLAVSPGICVARGVRDAVPRGPCKVEGAPRLLVIAPEASGAAAAASLQQKLGDSVTWLPALTGARAAADALPGVVDGLVKAGEAPHIVHFIGHGGTVDGHPVLKLAGGEPGGDGHWLRVDKLATYLAKARATLRLVSLEACDGAKPGELSSAAELLAKHGADAVVAHLWPVYAEQARELSARLYRSLLAGKGEATGADIGEAMLVARQALWAHGAIAYSPVLYLAGHNLVLFEQPQAEKPPEEKKAPDPPLVPPGPEPAPPSLVPVIAGVLGLGALGIGGFFLKQCFPPPKPADIVSCIVDRLKGGRQGESGARRIAEAYRQQKGIIVLTDGHDGLRDDALDRETWPHLQSCGDEHRMSPKLSAEIEVVASSSGVPVLGAQIDLRGQVATMGDAGKYLVRLDEVTPDGQLVLNVKHDAYEPVGARSVVLRHILKGVRIEMKQKPQPPPLPLPLPDDRPVGHDSGTKPLPEVSCGQLKQQIMSKAHRALSDHQRSGLATLTWTRADDGTVTLSCSGANCDVLSLSMPRSGGGACKRDEGAAQR